MAYAVRTSLGLTHQSFDVLVPSRLRPGDSFTTDKVFGKQRHEIVVPFGVDGGDKLTCIVVSEECHGGEEVIVYTRAGDMWITVPKHMTGGILIKDVGSSLAQWTEGAAHSEMRISLWRTCWRVAVGELLCTYLANSFTMCLCMHREAPSAGPDSHMPPVRRAQRDVMNGANVWRRFAGAELASLIESGAVAILDARWVIRLWKFGGVIRQRQELPEEAFLSVEEVISLHGRVDDLYNGDFDLYVWVPDLGLALRVCPV
jgi:hypothetical protein